MDNNEDILLSKWLDGSISAEELKQLEQTTDLVHLKAVLDQQKQFDLSTRPVETMWEDFEKGTAQQVEKETPSRRNFWLYLIAAVILGTLAFWYYTSDKETKVQTPPGEQKELRIADGTKIQISPSSFISYDEGNWFQLRHIQLKGQAFFEVSKGSPFLVSTPSGMVEVLGTAFDIWAFDDLMRVQCTEGKVRVRDKTGEVILTAGQQVSLNKKGFDSVTNFVSSEVDWLRQVMEYKTIPAKYIINDIRRFYNISIDERNINSNIDFSGVIPLNDQSKAIDFLAKTMNWQHEEQSGTILFQPN